MLREAAGRFEVYRTITYSIRVLQQVQGERKINFTLEIKITNHKTKNINSIRAAPSKSSGQSDLEGEVEAYRMIPYSARSHSTRNAHSVRTEIELF